MTNKHFIKDEELGGVERKYVEVQRLPVEGDYIHIAFCAQEEVDELRKVTTVDNDGDVYFDSPVGNIFGCNVVLVNEDTYTTFEPTDIMRHNGEREEDVLRVRPEEEEEDGAVLSDKVINLENEVANLKEREDSNRKDIEELARDITEGDDAVEVTIDGESLKKVITDLIRKEKCKDAEGPAAKFHYAPDEELGGVEREYEEVERDANVGDYVVGKGGTIYKVSRLAARDYYKTLSPTGRVCIDDTLFTLDTRDAQVGDEILAVEGAGALEEYDLGDVLIVIDADKWNDGTGVSVEGAICGLLHMEYLVLEPAEFPATANANADEHYETLKLIANLSAHIVKLEHRLDDVEEDGVFMGKDLAEIKAARGGANG